MARLAAAQPRKTKARPPSRVTTHPRDCADLTGSATATLVDWRNEFNEASQVSYRVRVDGGYGDVSLAWRGYCLGPPIVPHPANAARQEQPGVGDHP